MNATARTFLAIALVIVAAVLLLFGSGVMTGDMAGNGTFGGGGSLGAGMSKYGGFLILTLINVGLGTVVAWMLFGKGE